VVDSSIINTGSSNGDDSSCRHFPFEYEKSQAENISVKKLAYMSTPTIHA